MIYRDILPLICDYMTVRENLSVMRSISKEWCEIINKYWTPQCVNFEPKDLQVLSISPNHIVDCVADVLRNSIEFDFLCPLTIHTQLEPFFLTITKNALKKIQRFSINFVEATSLQWTARRNGLIISETALRNTIIQMKQLLILDVSLGFKLGSFGYTNRLCLNLDGFNSSSLKHLHIKGIRTDNFEPTLKGLGDIKAPNLEFIQLEFRSAPNSKDIYNLVRRCQQSLRELRIRDYDNDGFEVNQAIERALVMLADIKEIDVTQQNKKDEDKTEFFKWEVFEVPCLTVQIICSLHVLAPNLRVIKTSMADFVCSATVLKEIYRTALLQGGGLKVEVDGSSWKNFEDVVASCILNQNGRVQEENIFEVTCDSKAIVTIEFYDRFVTMGDGWWELRDRNYSSKMKISQIREEDSEIDDEEDF